MNRFFKSNDTHTSAIVIVAVSSLYAGWIHAGHPVVMFVSAVVCGVAAGVAQRCFSSRGDR